MGAAMFDVTAEIAWSGVAAHGAVTAHPRPPRPAEAAPERGGHAGGAPPVAGIGLALGFSTLGLPPARQFEAWQESGARLLDTVALADPAAGFPAERQVWTLGPFALGTVRAPRSRLARTAAHLRRDSLDHWVISIARRGERRFRVGEQCVSVPAGLAAIMSLDEAFEAERADVDWMCLYVPRDIFTEIGPVLDASRRKPLVSSMERVLATYLLQLASEVSRIGPAELPRVVEATRAIIAAAVQPSADAMAAAEAHIDRTQLARVKSIIRQQLRSALLRPERLCRAAGVSRSQLYRLFEPLGGVAHYIQAERLRAACRALASPSDAREISAIAEDVGFFDHSTFSRVFRREIGCSPRSFRTAALAGRPVPIRGSASDAAPRDIVDILRRL